MTVFLSHFPFFCLFVRTSFFLSHLLQILAFTISHKGLLIVSDAGILYVFMMRCPLWHTHEFQLTIYYNNIQLYV